MQFVGSSYDGLVTRDGRRFDGLGQYTFPNGDRYVGGMLDGAFHGHGILFFRRQRAADEVADDEKATRGGKAELLAFMNRGEGGKSEKSAPPPAPAAAAAAATDGAGAWYGQFRGVWEHGRNVSGSYLFFDGLVYSSETHPSGAADRQRAATNAREPPPQQQRMSTPAATVWPYCECTDRRVWSEHLRNITPVLPCASPLGGIALQEALAAANTTDAQPAQQQQQQRDTRPLWADMPILVPGSPAADLTPSAFAQGQPKSGADIARWCEVFQSCGSGDVHREGETENAATLEALHSIAEVIALPTAPLVEERDPDVEYDAEGNAHRRRRPVTDPNYQPRSLSALQSGVGQSLE